jgi:4-amino-4-deoxy-L-arabinose transferase-like glycosyltransferase
MTDTERQRLAEIDRALSAESPELARILAGAAGASRWRTARWAWTGAGTVVVGLLLLGLAAALGLVALAVFALCPPLTFGVILLGSRGRRWRRTARGTA